jgi:hypothetical protein
MLPPEMNPVREAALRALGPVKPIDSGTRAHQTFLFDGKRSDAGRQLPPYYLVYFLLVDLLGFRNLGQFEKISWSVPIDYHGKAFLVEHRKFGVGVFVQEPAQDEKAAREIVIRIQKAVKAASPFFDWMADQAVAASAVNVVNNSFALFERYNYFREKLQSKIDEAELRKDERLIKEHASPLGSRWGSISFPAVPLLTEANWLAMSAIEAFFSWTEHTLIHLSVLSGKAVTASEITSLAEADWAHKFKSALDITEPDIKRSYDALMAMRKELRNYIAHGAFGKQGEAFMFHSGAGAVPVLLPHRIGSKRFTLGHGLDFDSTVALSTIDTFIALLWSGPRTPAKIYIQDSHLPIILTMASDGTYARAMASVEDMSEFVEHLTGRFDQAANMDW